MHVRKRVGPPQRSDGRLGGAWDEARAVYSKLLTFFTELLTEFHIQFLELQYDVIPWEPNTRKGVYIREIPLFNSLVWGLVWFPDPSCMGGARKEREGRIW